MPGQDRSSVLTKPTQRILAIVERDFHIARSYRLAFILDAVYGVLSLAVYFFISRTFGDVRPADLNGAPTYFAFAAVGIALGVMIEAASAGVARRLREEQLAGTLETLVAQPVTPLQLCLGLIGFPFLFAVARSVFYLTIAAIWVGLDISKTDLIGALAVLVAAGFALAALGILAGAVVLVVKRGELLTASAVYAIALLSGSVFPISTLPGWLEAVGRVMPLRFALDGMRSALFKGESDGWGGDVLVLLGFGMIGIPICVWIFRAALRAARRSGSLTQY